MKCDICNEGIEELYLEKIKGTYIEGGAVCSFCQSKSDITD